MLLIFTAELKKILPCTRDTLAPQRLNALALWDIEKHFYLPPTLLPQVSSAQLDQPLQAFSPYIAAVTALLTFVNTMQTP